MSAARDERPEWVFRVRYRYDGQPESVRIVETRAESLDDVLNAIEDFLRAAGFRLPTNGLDVSRAEEGE